MRRRSGLSFVVGILSLIPAAAQTPARSGTSNGEWRYYAADSFSSKYSPLDQINESNVGQLKIAWRWKSDNFGPRPISNWEVTPLMVGGVLYFTAGASRVAVAADAGTGETLWMYRIEEGDRASQWPRVYNRGLSYWTDGRGDERILMITSGYRLVELDAKTGRTVDGFGEKGIVDLFQGLERAKAGYIGATSPPLIVGDVAIVGSALRAGGVPTSKTNTPGDVRAYDVRSGKLVWTFHTIPRLGEFGNNTWESDSWQYSGNTAVWAPMSADLELGYVYLPVETGTGDYYGGHRPGANLFAETLVCLNARTGERIWHYQFIHHGIWDWDIPTAPNLMDITVNGRQIKAVAQATKQGWVYTFDRVTGEPVWPIEERPVPAGDVPGEWYSPTQPFPTKPAAFDRQGVSEDDLNDMTPEIKAEALRIASEYKMGPIFTPPIVAGTNGKKGLLMLPAMTGGANWQGAAHDPETGMMYVASATSIATIALEHQPDRSDMNFVQSPPRLEGPFDLPLAKPPWGRVTAIDMNTGDHVWMKANGPTPELVRNNPKLKGVDLPETGNQDRPMLLVTGTLLFASEGSGQFLGGPLVGGPHFRALDKATGRLIHEMVLPGNTSGQPMTYMHEGKQYIVVAVANRGEGAELIALTLP